MVGMLLLRDGRQASLNEEGAWQSPDPHLAEYLEAFHSPHRPEPGLDEVLPFGVMSLERAARELGGQVRLASPPQPLPDGVIS